METAVYTLQEVADNLKCSISTVRNLIKRGQLQSMRVGNRHRITEEQLQAYKTAQSAHIQPTNTAESMPIMEDTGQSTESSRAAPLPDSWKKRKE